jgi:hypothetical protein
MSMNLSLVDRQVLSTDCKILNFQNFVSTGQTGMENRSDRVHLSSSRFRIILTPAHKIQIPNNVFIISFLFSAKFAFCSVSVLTKPVRPVCVSKRSSLRP